MTQPPRSRATTADGRAPKFPVPKPGGPSGLDRPVMSPKARFAADASVGLAVALLATAIAILVKINVGWGPAGPVWVVLWAVLCGVFPLFCGLTAPTARMLLGRFWEGWERHVEGLRERGSDRRWPALAVGSAAAPAAKGSGEKDAERQLLEAIERHGEVTAARVALETALTVVEADRRLGELAEKGHLEVNVRDGKLVYSF